MWQVEGQDHAVRQLSAGIVSGRLSHAYLLAGPPQVGKGTLALNLAQAVNCLSDASERPCGACRQCQRIALAQHADVRTIGLEQADGNRKEIGIDEVRDLEHQAHLEPYEGAYRVFIFDGAESMSEAAANALLKTLEEPPPQCLLVLVSSNEDALLPTIRSRCRRIELVPLPEDAVIRYLVERQDAGEDDAATLARLSQGRLGWAVTALRDPMVMQRRDTELERIASLMDGTLEQRFYAAADVATLFYRDRAQAKAVLDLWLGWWRDLLLLKEGAPDHLYNQDHREDLERRAQSYSAGQVAGYIARIRGTVTALEHNANARLALEVLMLQMPRAGAPAGA